MCSLAEGGFVEEPSAVVSLDGRLCQKCKVNPAVLTLRKKDVYCLECFVINCNHKFRSTLGKNKVMYKGDTVMLPFDGSANALVLLDLIHSSLTKDTSQKRHFYTVTVFIPDLVMNLMKTDRSERAKCVNNVIDLAMKYRKTFEIKVGHFESGLSADDPVTVVDVPDVQEFHYEIPHGSNEAELTSTLDSMTEASAKEEFLRVLQEKLVVKVAQQLGCNKVFDTESAADLAVTLMTGCSTGRGINLSDDTGFLNKRHQIDTSCNGAPQFQIVRPMREFSYEEVRAYIEWVLLPNGVTPIEVGQNDDTIRGLTRKFLLGLQVNFPATIPTIFRTTGKLQEHVIPKEETQSNNQCPLCVGKTTDVIDSPSVEATQISRLMSSIAHFNESGSGIDLSTQAIQDGVTLKEKLAEISSDVQTDEYNKACYSCRLIMDRMNGIPEFIKS